MLFSRVPIFMVIIVCLVTIYGLFSIKNNVMALRAELTEVKKQINRETDSIHVLKAEFAYLTSPQRLKALNDRHLKLKETKVSQMIVDPIKKSNSSQGTTIASKDSSRGNIIRNNMDRGNVKWRFKKGPTKYLTLTSGKKHGQ